jgi:hypothetical protein
MKKTLALILPLIVLLLCTGCVAQIFHKHEPSNGQLDRNLTEHWISCTCGEKIDAADHTLDGDICTVCNSKIVDDGDSVCVHNYNEFGDE